MPDKKKPWWAWLVWFQLLFVCCCTVYAHLGGIDLRILGIPGADKMGHFLFFGALSLFAVGWFVRRPAALVIGALAAISAIEEIVQAWSPNRTFDFGDLAATLTGIMLFGLLGAHLTQPANKPLP